MPESVEAMPSVAWPVLRALAQSRHEVLLLWLADQALYQGHSVLALSQVLDVTPGYLMKMYRGHWQVSAAGRRVVNAIARYLGLSPVVVRLAAGQLQLSDFYTPASLAQAGSALRACLPADRAVLPAMEDITAAFACQLAGAVSPPRHVMRDIVADGPSGRR